MLECPFFVFDDRSLDNLVRDQILIWQFFIGHWVCVVVNEPHLHVAALVGVAYCIHDWVDHDHLGDWAEESLGLVFEIYFLHFI